MFKKAMMTLQHVNLRRERDEDTAETAVDLKLRGTVLADVQDTLTGDRPLPLWDAQDAPSIPGIVLDLPGEIKDMTLDLGSVRLVGCRARKFKLEPEAFTNLSRKAELVHLAATYKIDLPEKRKSWEACKASELKDALCDQAEKLAGRPQILQDIYEKVEEPLVRGGGWLVGDDEEDLEEDAA